MALAPDQAVGRPRGFAVRLGLATSLLIALVCAAQSVALGRRALDHVRGYLGDRGRAVADRLADDVAPYLAGGNVAALKALAEQAAAESEVAYIRVLDAHGLLLAATGQPPSESANVWEFSSAIHATHRLGREARSSVGGLAVTAASEPELGTAVVGISLEPLDTLRRRTLTTAMLFTGLFTLIAVFGAALLARAITRPLHALAVAVDRLAHGDFTARVAIASRDEIGWLASGFNAMAESLGRSRDALEDKVRELEEANHVKTEFLATVSHELRTPLNVILGYAEMLGDDAGNTLTDEQTEMLDAIRRYSKLQLELITSVLDFARLSSGRVSFHVERFAMEALLTEVQALFTPRLRGPEVTLVVIVDPDLPPLETDRVKLQEVVHNLVDNAVKFTARGTIDIAARRGRAAGWVTIEVTDSGIGIRAEERESIFEAFRQIGTSSTRTTGGVGLGLSIVKQLAEALGGTVAVVSTPGAGSTFRVDVPCRLPTAAETPTAVTALDQTARNAAALPARTLPRRAALSHRPVNDPD